jgi:hypothetical protein
MFTNVFEMGKLHVDEAKPMIWVADRDPDPDLLQFLEACLVRSMGSDVQLLQSGDAARLPRPPSIVLMSGDAGRLARARRLAYCLLPKPFPLSELVWSVGTLFVKGARA